MFSSGVGLGIRAGLNAQYSSAPPYTITTGVDNNADTIFNDRPVGVSRNSARGADQWNVTLRLNRSFNLGGLMGPGSGPIMIGTPPPPPPPGGANNSRTSPVSAPSSRSALAAQGPGGAGAGGGPVVREVMMADGGGFSRYRLDLYIQASNLFNVTNLNGYVGNILSPYFGQATSAAPARRVEIGASLSF
jgi:hypothetical protein